MAFNQTLQQLSIKQTTRNFLKVVLSNTFRKFLGSDLSAKRCMDLVTMQNVVNNDFNLFLQ
jgi:hypothetical protein